MSPKYIELLRAIYAPHPGDSFNKRTVLSLCDEVDRLRGIAPEGWEWNGEQWMRHGDDGLIRHAFSYLDAACWEVFDARGGGWHRLVASGSASTIRDAVFAADAVKVL